MQKKTLFLLLALLLTSTLACSLFSGAAPADAPVAEAPAEGAQAEGAAAEAPAEAANVEADFPIPDDVDNVMDVGNGSLNFQTSLSLLDAVSFYRYELVEELGYTERDILTVWGDQTFSIVFDGHPSGKAIVVQGVDLGDSTNINIRLEDI